MNNYYKSQKYLETNHAEEDGFEDIYCYSVKDKDVHINLITYHVDYVDISIDNSSNIPEEPSSHTIHDLQLKMSSFLTPLLHNNASLPHIYIYPKF